MTQHTPRHHFFDPTPAELTRTNHRTRARPLVVRDPQDFPENTWRGGQVVDIDDTTFVTDPGTRGARTYPDTNIPVPQLIITVATDNPNPENPHDDGHRAIWIPRDPPWRYRALCDAMTTAGVPETLPAIGGQLWIKYRTLPASTVPALSRQRYDWEMRYTP